MAKMKKVNWKKKGIAAASLLVVFGVYEYVISPLIGKLIGKMKGATA